MKERDVVFLEIKAMPVGEQFIKGICVEFVMLVFVSFVRIFVGDSFLVVLEPSFRVGEQLVSLLDLHEFATSIWVTILIRMPARLFIDFRGHAVEKGCLPFFDQGLVSLLNVLCRSRPIHPQNVVRVT